MESGSNQMWILFDPLLVMRIMWSNRTLLDSVYTEPTTTTPTQHIISFAWWNFNWFHMPISSCRVANKYSMGIFVNELFTNRKLEWVCDWLNLPEYICHLYTVPISIFLFSLWHNLLLIPQSVSSLFVITIPLTVRHMPVLLSHNNERSSPFIHPFFFSFSHRLDSNIDIPSTSRRIPFTYSSRWNVNKTSPSLLQWNP